MPAASPPALRACKARRSAGNVTCKDSARLGIASCSLGGFAEPVPFLRFGGGLRGRPCCCALQFCLLQKCHVYRGRIDCQALCWECKKKTVGFQSQGVAWTVRPQMRHPQDVEEGIRTSVWGSWGRSARGADMHLGPKDDEGFVR